MKASSTLRVLVKGNFLTLKWTVGACVGSFSKVSMVVIIFFLCRTGLFDLKVQSSFLLSWWLPVCLKNLTLLESLIQPVCTAVQAEFTGYLTGIQGLGGRLLMNLQYFYCVWRSHWSVLYPEKDRDICSLLVPWFSQERGKLEGLCSQECTGQTFNMQHSSQP